jgi:hypothetical protein
MYVRILVPLENSSYDETILTHVRQLARHHGSALLLIHVADGWAARNITQLGLRESEEMREDRAYLERVDRDRPDRHPGALRPDRHGHPWAPRLERCGAGKRGQRVATQDAHSRADGTSGA